MLGWAMPISEARDYVCVTRVSPPQLLHVAIVCAGHNSSREVITLVKSMLFYRYSQVSLEEGQEWERGQNLGESLVSGLQLPYLWHGDGLPSSLEGWLREHPSRPGQALCSRSSIHL